MIKFWETFSIRAKELERVLAPLSGRQRAIMKAILTNVNTDQLQDGYDTFISRVQEETTPDNSIS